MTISSSAITMVKVVGSRHLKLLVWSWGLSVTKLTWFVEPNTLFFTFVPERKRSYCNSHGHKRSLSGKHTVCCSKHLKKMTEAVKTQIGVASTGDKDIPFKWTRDVTVFFPVISLISSCAVLLSFSSGCSSIFHFLDQFQAPMITAFKEKSKWIVKKVSLLVFVQIMCMDVTLLHIHWSNSSPAAAEVVISAYHSILRIIQRLLESWRCKPYLTSKRHDSNLSQGWLLQNCQASKRFSTKLISTILPLSFSTWWLQSEYQGVADLEYLSFIHI